MCGGLVVSGLDAAGFVFLENVSLMLWWGDGSSRWRCTQMRSQRTRVRSLCCHKCIGFIGFEVASTCFGLGCASFDLHASFEFLFFGCHRSCIMWHSYFQRMLTCGVLLGVCARSCEFVHTPKPMNRMNAMVSLHVLCIIGFI